MFYSQNFNSWLPCLSIGGEGGNYEDGLQQTFWYGLLARKISNKNIRICWILCRKDLIMSHAWKSRNLIFSIASFSSFDHKLIESPYIQAFSSHIHVTTSHNSTIWIHQAITPVTEVDSKKLGHSRDGKIWQIPCQEFWLNCASKKLRILFSCFTPDQKVNAIKAPRWIDIFHILWSISCHTEQSSRWRCLLKDTMLGRKLITEW